MNTNTKFTFTNKETYLAYRAEWKSEYAATADTIRATKKSIRQQHREQGYASGSNWSTLVAATRKATDLLSTLSEAKAEAGHQYQAAKETM